MNRGSRGLAGLAQGQARASMRPRFMNRGSDTFEVITGDEASLQ